MKQCLLRKGNRYQTAWLPVEFCKVGKYLRLDVDNGWRVEAVYSLFQASVDVPRGYFAGGVWS